MWLQSPPAIARGDGEWPAGSDGFLCVSTDYGKRVLTDKHAGTSDCYRGLFDAEA